MFEQESYRYETPAAKAQPGDLFYKYEIKNWEIGPRIYKILGVSLLVNIFGLFIFAQANLLTMRGCDSPFVGRVCSVLDTVYVSTLLFGDERAYVDMAYEKTELEDAEVTWIDRTGDTGPFVYPEGYFQVANPEQQYGIDQLAPTDAFSGFTSPIPTYPTPNLGRPLTNTPQVLPTPNSNAVVGQIPDDPLGKPEDSSGAIITRKKGRGGRVVPNANANANAGTEVAQNNANANAAPEPAPTPMSSEAVTSLEVNRKPLTDFVEMVLAKRSGNEVDLNQPFAISLDGTLTKEGRLDPKKSRWDRTKEKGDPRMIEVAKEGLEAIGDSGFLQYLKSLGVDKVNFTLVQDENQITAVITSSQQTPGRANIIKNGLDVYLGIGRQAAKDPSDELTLLNGAKVTSEGSNFVLNFAIPKPIAQEMINRRLQEAQAKKAQQGQPQSSGSAPSSASSNIARE